MTYTLVTRDRDVFDATCLHPGAIAGCWGGYGLARGVVTFLSLHEAIAASRETGAKVAPAAL